MKNKMPNPIIDVILLGSFIRVEYFNGKKENGIYVPEEGI